MVTQRNTQELETREECCPKDIFFMCKRLPIYTPGSGEEHTRKGIHEECHPNEIVLICRRVPIYTPWEEHTRKGNYEECHPTDIVPLIPRRLTICTALILSEAAAVALTLGSH